LARIKKIMKSDEDVRMISSEAPALFAKACEMFILEVRCRVAPLLSHRAPRDCRGPTPGAAGCDTRAAPGRGNTGAHPSRVTRRTLWGGRERGSLADPPGRRVAADIMSPV
jgi:hypothetical protein